MFLPICYTNCCKNGTKKWYQNGKLHSDNGPAVIRKDGHREWYQNGKLHSDNGPAIIQKDGYQEWYQNGKLHSFVTQTYNNPAVIYANGDQFWYQHANIRRPGRLLYKRVVNRNGTRMISGLSTEITSQPAFAYQTVNSIHCFLCVLYKRKIEKDKPINR